MRDLQRRLPARKVHIAMNTASADIWLEVRAGQRSQLPGSAGTPPPDSSGWRGRHRSLRLRPRHPPFSQYHDRAPRRRDIPNLQERPTGDRRQLALDCRKTKPCASAAVPKRLDWLRHLQSDRGGEACKARKMRATWDSQRISHSAESSVRRSGMLLRSRLSK